MRIFFLLIALMTANPAFPQKKGQEIIDSMLHELPAAKDDTNKVKLFINIAQQYISFNPKEGFKYANTGIELAQKLQWKRGVANLNNSLGLMTGDTGNNAEARDYFEKSYAINKELDAKPFMIANMNNIGRSYEREADFSKASEYYFKAMDIAERSGNDEQAALVGTNITSLYITQQDYPKAAKYAAITIKKGEAAHAMIHVAKAHELLGIINLETNDSLSAKENFNQALSINEKLGNKMAVVGVLSNIASAEPDPAKAIEAFLTIQQILDSIAPSSQASVVNLANLGVNYFGLGMEKSGKEREEDLNNAERYLIRGEALCKSTNNREFEANIKQVMSNLLEARGNYKAALQFYKDFVAINDSIFSQGNKNKIAHLESQRAIDLKNKEIENEQLQLSSQRTQSIFLISGLFLLGIIGILFYRQSRTRKKMNTALTHLNSELNEANKLKAKFFAILSHDLRSPVASLINFLRLQKRDPDLLSEQQKQDAEQKITTAAELLLETMETMLLWSKGQMENFKPQIQIVAVNNLFNYLDRSFSSNEKIRLVFTNPQDLTVSSDENYLQTIMYNLTSNAVKALANVNDAVIEWKAFHKNGKTILSITDNGPGMSQESMNSLYNETIVPNAKTGLGLHLVRDLAKAIQCSINIQSQAGQGTTFSLFG